MSKGFLKLVLSAFLNKIKLATAAQKKH